MTADLIVIHEHPEWQKPLFAALRRRDVLFAAYDAKRNAFDPARLPRARLYFNQASPSAYIRGNARAVPLVLSFMRALETGGARVLNGSRAFALELSKGTQSALMFQLGVDNPRTVVFNDPATALDQWKAGWPALLKPEQGGSGARMYLLQSPDEFLGLLRDRPDLWLPDNLLLLQEYLPHEPTRGIVRMEFLGGELLYAMRVVSHGAFNLCPSEICNPEGGIGGHCEVPTSAPVKPTEFYPYLEIPSEVVQIGKRLVAAGGLDVAGIEYLEWNGRHVFYDINANSNLRKPIGEAFGFDPFEKVAEWLNSQIT
jgi:glutathione synthase/RimK-type ligase-like ATP-grasp enzyme